MQRQLSTRRALTAVAVVWGLMVLFSAGQVSASESLSVPDGAFEQDGYDGDDPRVTTRLLVDAGQVRPGDRVDVGIHFDIDPGWHIYWKSPGEGGMSTLVEFGASPGQTGPVQWPQPGIYRESGGTITTFGYSDQVLLFGQIEIPEHAEGQVEVTGQTSYLVCEVDCIPGDAELVRTLPVTEQTEPADEATARQFRTARDALPQPADDLGVELDVRYSQVPIEPGEQFRVELSVIGCHSDEDDNCVQLAAPPEDPAQALVFESIDTISLQVGRVVEHPEAASGWLVELQGRASQDEPPGDGSLAGVVRLRDADGQWLPTTLDVLFPRTDSEAARQLLGAASDDATADADDGPGEGTDTDPEGSLPYVLLLAFVGGAILNLMPCVFPVLAVKVFAFVNLVHEERQSIYVHGATYTAGIVASMLVLAGAVIALQMVGTRVGWGFQFQQPWFIAVVGAVIVVFALNLFGVFQVTVNPGRLEEVTEAPASPTRSFGEGVLAVVLATPCSAPLLGTAVGFALASPPWVVALTFAVLGLGLAAPFVVLTLVPGAADFLPRPGRWMEHFKQFLGFALLATAVWLVWLIGQMSGTGAVIGLLIFFLACAIGAWIYGIVQFRSPTARRTGLVVAVLLVVASGMFTLQFDEPTESSQGDVAGGEEARIDWQPWSDEAVDQQLDQDRVVFVNFTADWCITCKANEANVLERQQVLEAIDAHDVAMLKADWTRRDDHIRQKLADFGKGGVPLYLVYSPAQPEEPNVLPELLTRAMVVEAMEEANEK